MYLFSYACMYGLFYISMYEYHHFGLLANLLSILWCIFSHVFPSKPCTIIGFQGAHSPHPQLVRTSHAPSLTYCSCHTLATNNDILLASVRNCDQGITIRPTAGTPTPNGLRSNWDFLLGRSLGMLAGPTSSTFLVLEGGPDDKLSSHHLFWIFHIYNGVCYSLPSEMSIQWTYLSHRDGVMGSLVTNHVWWWRRSGLAWALRWLPCSHGGHVRF